MSDYSDYVEKYAIKHKLTIEEAEKHDLVVAYKKYCEELAENAKNIQGLSENKKQSTC